MNSPNNMKSTWPMPAPHVGDLTQPIFHLLGLGVRVGGNAKFRVRVGGNANFRVGVGSARLFGYQHVVVFPTQNSRVGGTAHCKPPTRGALRCSGI